ncbi:Asp23/Gls24 family envelope stress response protein [Cryobacterium sp. AP23]
MTAISPSPLPTVDSATETDAGTAPSGAGRGTTVINDSVVTKIAGLAVRDVPGVHALGGGAARALGAIREAISNTDHGQGISVQVNENDVTVELSLVADYPVALQQVADDARTAIIDAIESLAGLKVTEVNVTINDVHLPDGATETDEVPVP